ncbi:tetratricopeptide repeat-containing diguanylate cyclase [Neptunicella marina]|uniref:diguanylate cyclase n=1 Tax=Neptunicella marina TaxID=2125989 RepID=A0A8J6IRR2_9ALTE|nr:GGDEF domain-containing protein [Neptunicella marina]MBC3764381.1 GGDEF domain-containing protein [Neptunicella marina]
MKYFRPIIIGLYFSFSAIQLSLAESLDSASSINQALENADLIRSSDIEKFRQKLSDISQIQHQLTTEQQNYLNYLQAYNLAYTGKTLEAEAILRDISNADVSINLRHRAAATLVNLAAIAENWSVVMSILPQVVTEVSQVTDERTKTVILMAVAVTYNRMNQYELGYEYAKNLLSIAKSPRNICFAHKLMVEAQLNLNQIYEFGPETDKAITLCNEANESLEVSEIRSEAAKKMLEHQRYKELIRYLNQFLAQAEQTKYNKVISEFYSMLAEGYFMSGDMQIAKEFALKSINTGKELGNAEPKVRAYHVLYKINQRQNNYQKALEYHIQYAIADKKNLDAIKAKQIAFQLGQQNYIEQQNKIEKLDHQNKLLTVEKQLSQSNANRNQLMMILLFIGLVIAFSWAYRIKRSHEKLRLMAEYDELTGVYSRAHFKIIAKSTLEYCNHTEQEVCCIVFDLDQFKNINDSFGHSSGDWVLKTVVDLCLAQAPQQTIISRIGGEEFCMLMPATPLIGALNFAQTCRKEIEKIVTADTGHHFNVSASFGVTSSRLSGYSLDALLADADTAMYVSKKMGRNRVSQHFRELDSPGDKQHQDELPQSAAKY